MTEIYLIRHMQAEGNLYIVMQGHWDGDVTALGLRQAELLGERFRALPVDALYSSDLYRARLTAAAIQKYHDLPLRTDKRLREINVGRWEGRFFGDLLHEEPESVNMYMNCPDEWHMDGAENEADVMARAFPALREIAEENGGRTAVVVSHGVTIRCLLRAALGMTRGEQKKLPIASNTAVTRLLYENGVFRADYINDSAHLEPLHLPPWGRTPVLRAEPLDVLREGDWYADCYAAAWRAAHGSLRGFQPEPYLKSAAEHARMDPASVLRFTCDGEPMGLLELDVKRGQGAGYGWISLLYLSPAYRNRGLGIQLLGRAIMRYKELGRHALRLHAAAENAPALAFYRKWGFEELSEESRALGKLLLLEKKWGGDRHV